MAWIDWLESRFGFLAIPRLVPMIALLNALVYVLFLIQPEYIHLLTLEPSRVLHGEIWRVVSYIFVPEIFLGSRNPFFQPLSFLLYIWFMVWVGNALEQAWGSFRVTLYYLVGMVGVTIAAFILGLGQSQGNDTPFFLNMSLFFAFATLFPDQQIYIFLIIPLRVKWMALLSLLPIAFSFIIGPVIVKIAILVCLINYILFFGPQAWSGARTRRTTQKRRQRFVSHSVPADEPLHRCAICKRTERDNPELDFRVARNGEEYCIEHLPKTAEAPSSR